MVDLSAIASAQTQIGNITSAATGLSNLILVDLQKNIGIQAMAPAKVDSFLFNYEGENQITLQSDITDHYAEDNAPLHDQISLKPLQVKVTGYVGELADITPGIESTLNAITSKLALLDPYVPGLSATATRAMNTANQLYQTGASVANTAVYAWNSLSGSGSGGKPPQTKQQVAFTKFYNYWISRQLFKVQTPWCIRENMAIMSLTAIQDEETRTITSFEIVFKELRFASTFASASASKVLQERLSSMGSSVIDQGIMSTSDGGTVINASKQIGLIA